MSLKNSNDTIGNRARDLPVCSVVLDIEGLHDFYSSPVIIMVMEPRRLRWAVLVVRLGEKRNACKVLARKPEGKTLLEKDLSLDGRIVLK